MRWAVSRTDCNAFESMPPEEKHTCRAMCQYASMFHDRSVLSSFYIPLVSTLSSWHLFVLFAFLTVLFVLLPTTTSIEMDNAAETETSLVHQFWPGRARRIIKQSGWLEAMHSVSSFICRHLSYLHKHHKTTLGPLLSKTEKTEPTRKSQNVHVKPS